MERYFFRRSRDIYEDLKKIYGNLSETVCEETGKEGK